MSLIWVVVWVVEWVSRRVLSWVAVWVFKFQARAIMDGNPVQGSFGQSSGVIKLGTEVVELLCGWFLGRTGRVIPRDRDMDRHTRYGIFFTFT